MRRFPTVAAHDLEGTAVTLPGAFTGERNVVVIAFRARHQVLVDSWLPWLQARAAADPDLRYYEVPTSSSAWLPVRGLIDSGMAGAVREVEARRRTLTVYGDRRRVTDAVGIADIATITVAVVDRGGWIRSTATGPFNDAAAAEVAAALDAIVAGEPVEQAVPSVEQFGFDFEPRFRRVLAAIGVAPETATVSLDDERLEARFGPWTCRARISDVRDVARTDPLPWHRAVGARLSSGDCGLVFGTGTGGGVRVRFSRPVPGLLPLGVLRHPALTVTVADPEGFADAIRRRVAVAAR